MSRYLSLCRSLARSVPRVPRASLSSSSESNAETPTVGEAAVVNNESNNTLVEEEDENDSFLSRFFKREEFIPLDCLYMKQDALSEKEKGSGEDVW